MGHKGRAIPATCGDGAMAEDNAADIGPENKTKSGTGLGIASCLLALVGGGIFLFRWFFWFVAILLGLVSLRAAGRRPRRKGWFLWGTLGIALAAAGILYAAIADYPSVLRMTIPPVNHLERPLPEVLQDFCRHVHNQGRCVSFALHEGDLKVQRTTFRTMGPMSLRQALRKLTRSAGCSFSYRRCGTCGAIVPWIAIWKHHRARQEGESRLVIRHDEIRTYGGWEDEGSESEGERTESSVGGQSTAIP